MAALDAARVASTLAEGGEVGISIDGTDHTLGPDDLTMALRAAGGLRGRGRGRPRGGAAAGDRRGAPPRGPRPGDRPRRPESRAKRRASRSPTGSPSGSAATRSWSRSPASTSPTSPARPWRRASPSATRSGDAGEASTTSTASSCGSRSARFEASAARGPVPRARSWRRSASPSSARAALRPKCGDGVGGERIDAGGVVGPGPASPAPAHPRRLVPLRRPRIRTADPRPRRSPRDSSLTTSPIRSATSRRRSNGCAPKRADCGKSSALDRVYAYGSSAGGTLAALLSGDHLVAPRSPRRRSPTSSPGTWPLGQVRPELLGKPRRRPRRPRTALADPPPAAGSAAADPGPRRPCRATIDERNVRCGLSSGKSLVGGRWAHDRACAPVPVTRAMHWLAKIATRKIGAGRAEDAAETARAPKVGTERSSAIRPLVPRLAPF